MARVGVVAVNTSLNLRQSPGGPIIDSLGNGTRLTILESANGWHKVEAPTPQGNRTGFVSADFVVVDEATPETPAPGFRFVGKEAVAPDGTAFARKFRLGVFNNGTTTMREFVAANRDLFPGVAPSLLRVMEAVSANEGRLEAINTWDNAFLTFGAFQWTAGSGDGKGELPAMLDRLKRQDGEAYERCFGRFGLDVAEVTPESPGPASDVPRGRFSLNVRVLRSAADKEVLRSLEWPYRFWRAGHDPAVRRAEIEHAIARIDVFYRNPGKRVRNRFVADYVTSEYGVALLLDQHVNRPGHVPGTLHKAADRIAQELGSDDPTNWGFAEEKRLLDLYLQFRAQTSMTDQAQRAERTKMAVSSGLASDQRGSFVMAV